MDTRRHLIVQALTLSTKRKHIQMLDAIERTWDTASPGQRNAWYCAALFTARKLTPSMVEAGRLAKELLDA